MMTLPTAIAPLADYRRWVAWKWVTLPDGKRDKPPFRADFPDFHASTTNPKSWAPFSVAVSTMAAGKADGIGYVCADDAENVYWDLDNCRDPITGEIADWAMEFVEECDSYTEITPSGQGLRIIGTHDGAFKAPIHAAYKLPGGGSGEIFFRAVRYITVTGNRLPGTPDRLNDISGPVLDLLARAGKAQAAKPMPEFGGTRSREEAVAPIGDVRAALRAIPNDDLPYDDWVRTGIAAFAASGGTGEGFEAWQAWSAKSGKHQDAECLRVWRSIERSPPKRIGFGSLCYLARSVNPMFVAPSWTGERQGVTATTAAGTTYDAETGEILSEAPPQAASAPVRSRAFDLVWFDDITPCLDANDFVQGVLIENSAAVVYGESNAGKTFWTTDLALHVAAGKTWNGRRVEQGGVVYCVLEGGVGFRNRVTAWRGTHTPDSPVHFAAIQSGMNLLLPEADTPKLIAAIKEAAERIGAPVKLIVIDTLSRAFAGGNENASEDMGLLVQNMDAIRRETGACVLFVHHSGKDQAKGARGHSLLRAAIDTEIEVKAAEDSPVKTATTVKQREVKKGEVFHFQLEVVELGKNRHGEPVTTCVVNTPSAEDIAQAEAAGADRLSDDQAAALRVLTNLLAASGSVSPDPDMPDNVRSVPESWWADRFKQEAKPGATDDAKRKAFRRAADKLLHLRKVGQANGRVWLV